MVITHKENIVKEEDVVGEIICNQCGKNISYRQEEFIEITKRFGYFAKLFEDGESHEFHLCEKCYLKLVNSFKIPIEKQISEYVE